MSSTKKPKGDEVYCYGEVEMYDAQPTTILCSDETAKELNLKYGIDIYENPARHLRRVPNEKKSVMRLIAEDFCPELKDKMIVRVLKDKTERELEALVHSEDEKKPGCYYFVQCQGTDWSCTCPDWQKRKSNFDNPIECKHIQAVRTRTDGVEYYGTSTD